MSVAQQELTMFDTIARLETVVGGQTAQKDTKDPGPGYGRGLVPLHAPNGTYSDAMCSPLGEDLIKQLAEKGITGFEPGDYFCRPFGNPRQGPPQSAKERGL
jgi:hypothetical protein